MTIRIELGERTCNLLERLGCLFANYIDRCSRKPLSIIGGQFMFIVKADHADFTYSLGPISLADSEGNPIPTTQPFAYEVTSDNPTAIEVRPDLDPDGNETPHGTIHVGGPATGGEPVIANLVAKVSYGGTLIHTADASFTVTAGDVAAISGGEITFTGLEDAAPV